jgi:hypothetical protein
MRSSPPCSRPSLPIRSIFPKASNEIGSRSTGSSRRLFTAVNDQGARRRTPETAWEQRAGQSRRAGAASPAGFPAGSGRRASAMSRGSRNPRSSEEEFADLIQEASKEISRQGRDRHPHHRGRAADRHGHRGDGREPRPPRCGHRADACRGHADVQAILRPKMVLADIQLADGSSGIDAVNEILGMTPCR